eukprot:TRINITY_DN905_c0_g1_i1.p1 TRINITY_DN905_c0_g1~~TRINITY_DN905_c0_g1_i1.p1  ORF type:complete len:323 (-),score=54.14 TRINITY_DN905_c0_g1_i1:820-1710(-)
MESMLLDSQTQSKGNSSRNVVMALAAAVVVLSVAVIGLGVGLGLKMTAPPTPVTANLGGVPNAFSGSVYVSRALDFSPSYVPTGAAPAVLHTFTIDMNAGLEEVILRGPNGGAVVITTDYTNGVQKVTGASCSVLPLDFTENGWNFKAVSESTVDTITVNGATCTRYVATRTDGSTFQYSKTADGSICHIMDNGQMITFASFTNAAVFTNDMTVPCAGTTTSSTKMATKSLIGSVWGDVKCDGCKTLAESVLEAGVEGGCTLVSDGLADELCETALELACEGMGCSDRLCDAIHLC